VKNRKESMDNDTMSGEIFTPEILYDDLLISSFAVSDDLIVFSQWNISKLFIYSLKTKKLEILCEFEESLSCPSISFLKNEGIKFLFVALSNGKMLYYKLKSKFIL
jgi:hypothetical protein